MRWFNASIYTLFLFAIISLGPSSFASSYKSVYGSTSYKHHLNVIRFTACSEFTVIINHTDDSYLIISKNLDKDCFQNHSNALRTHVASVDEIDAVNKNDPTVLNSGKFGKDKTFQIYDVISPYNYQCFEECRFTKSQIIEKDQLTVSLYYDDYYFIEVEDFKDRFLFKINMGTHTRNIFYSIKNMKLINFPNGSLEVTNDGVIVSGQKSYLPGPGGAFWFNSKRDFAGKIIEFIDEKYGTCLSAEKFHPELRSALNKVRKESLCVFQK